MIRALGIFLKDSGYDPKTLSEEFDLSEGPYANNENLESLLIKTAGSGLLALLARLFFVGAPVEASHAARLIPDYILRACINSDLLTEANGKIEPRASLIPFQDWIIACDNPRLRGSTPDMVVGPAGTSTQFLSRLAIGGENETTLDLGTGSGVLAIQASRYSRAISGTDINSRSIQFARLSAALNGVSNAEFETGDAFAPVNGRRFTRILANPPFFMTPASKFTYCDSPLQLDGFTERIATEASDYLEEGGYFQMICQWADLESQPWEQRLREWTARSGCDVLVLLAPSLTPVQYAQIRAKEAHLAHSTPPEFTLAERVNYLRSHGVKSICSGVINMRKRTGGRNWFVTLRNDPAGPNVGPGIQDRFESLTYLASQTPKQMMQTRFRFAADVQLETILHPGTPDWTTASIELVKSETLVDRLRLDSTVAKCLPLFDGQRSLAEVAQSISKELTVSEQDAESRCLQLARRLLQGSFLKF